MTHKNVSESYNLCKSLLFITLEESEHLIIDLFIKEKCEDISQNVEKYEDEKHFVIQLAMDIDTYIENKAKNSKDGRLKYLCNFYILSKTFRLYVNAQSRGDFLES